MEYPTKMALKNHIIYPYIISLSSYILFSSHIFLKIALEIPEIPSPPMAQWGKKGSGITSSHHLVRCAVMHH